MPAGADAVSAAFLASTCGVAAGFAAAGEGVVGAGDALEVEDLGVTDVVCGLSSPPPPQPDSAEAQTAAKAEVRHSCVARMTDPRCETRVLETFIARPSFVCDFSSDRRFRTKRASRNLVEQQFLGMRIVRFPLA